jgi:hypothetical protein
MFLTTPKFPPQHNEQRRQVVQIITAFEDDQDDSIEETPADAS